MLTLEDLLCSAAGFGLTTATPVQRAICRVADGLPLGELASCTDVLDALGDVTVLPPGVRPMELYLLSGVRTGKSLFAAALAVRSALSCDLSRLRPGEPVRVSVLSLTRDLADVVVSHLTGTIRSKPALRSLLVGEPTADGVVLRHPSGHEVEVVVVAGARAGASVVARWSAGVIFDEAPRMSGEEDGVVNFSETRRAALGRLLPGAQLVAIGSPWAPRGPMYEAVQAHWRKPSAQLVVVKCEAWKLNPVWWTPARIAQVRASQNGDLIHRTDVLAEFADPSSSLIASSELRQITRRGPPPVPRMGAHVVAAMDPGTRGNSWTLVVAEYTERGDGTYVVAVVHARQWTGTSAAPLQPDRVLGEVAADLRRWGLREVWSDQHAADFVVAIAARYGLEVQVETVTAASKAEMYESLRARIADGAVEIPDDPAVRADLLSLRKVITRNGIAIDLPRSADGRHCDFASAVALAVAKAGAGGGAPEWIEAMRAYASSAGKPPIAGDRMGRSWKCWGQTPQFDSTQSAELVEGGGPGEVRWSASASEQFKSAAVGWLASRGAFDTADSGACDDEDLTRHEGQGGMVEVHGRSSLRFPGACTGRFRPDDKDTVWSDSALMCEGFRAAVARYRKHHRI